jgi:hypothetical protein
MDFPLLYCNGCSYSSEEPHPGLKNNVYINQIQRHIGKGYVLNKAISGSNNRRIIRTSVHDLYLQRVTNPSQQIIALIQLSFEVRGEIWNAELGKNQRWHPEESEFITHQFSTRSDWRERLLNFLDIGTKNNRVKDESAKMFLDKYSQGRAYFYSPYQERINLMCDLVMFVNTCKQLNVDFLIFQGPAAESLQEEYLLDFFKSHLPNDNIFDFEKFSFCGWCDNQGFDPIDTTEPRSIGHYQADAHCAFGREVIIPKLEQLKII